MQFLHGSMWRGRSGAIAGAAAGLLVMMSPSAFADVIYVDDDAPLLGDGQSWVTAYKFLQDALAVAAADDEIRVAQGTYWPDHSEGDPGNLGDRNATFQLLGDVTLMGGYAGLGAEDPDARDVDLYETVLSGDLLGNDLPDFVNYEENSYHVVTASGVSATAVIDGFTIEGGFAEERNGAGMYFEAGSPALRNCKFRRNLATGGAVELTGFGGGLYGTGIGAPTFDTCSFIGNKIIGEYESTGAGGAAMFHHGCSPVLSDCAFTENLAVGLADSTGFGAGVLCSDEVTAEFTDCTFTRNEASSDVFNAGAIAGIGADKNVILTMTRCIFEENVSNGITAVWVTEGSELHLTECEFRANIASENATGYSGYSAGVGVYDSTATIDQCVFTDNVAEDAAGALWIGSGAAAIVTRSTFLRNAARRYGGAVRKAYGASFDAINIVFADNTATSGGALDARGSATLTNVLFAGNQAEYGGAIHNFNGFPVLTNVTFADNTATAEEGGGGMYSTNASFPSIRNSIFWGNTGGQIVDVDTSVTAVDYCDVENGWPGKGNIAVDTAFVDPTNGDYRLAAGSPCIDAAHNNAVPPDGQDLDGDGDYAERTPDDLDDNPRFANDENTADTGCGHPAVVDMGAYEHDGVPEHPVYVGDVNGDGFVGFDDLLQVLSTWGECLDDCCMADVDFNLEVGFDDLLLVLSNWS